MKEKESETERERDREKKKREREGRCRLGQGRQRAMIRRRGEKNKGVRKQQDHLNSIMWLRFPRR